MSSTQPIPLCQYGYDALDRLVNLVQPNRPAHQRFYCGSRLTTELQSALRYSIIQHEDQLLAQQKIDGDAPDTTLLATDQPRSVLHTLKSNQQSQFIGYSPYGHRPPECQLLTLLGFNGQRQDSVTGHYYLGNGHRGFNPVLMRFNSPDSLSPFGMGGLNSYAYCSGDPINLQDESGRSALILWRDITENLISVLKLRRFVATSNVDGLLKMKTEVASQITRKKTANFIQLLSDTSKLHQHRHTPQALEALALEQFQKSSRRISAPVPPKYRNLPRKSEQPRPTTAQLKTDTDNLNQAALRDASGSITNFSVMKLHLGHREAIFQNQNLERPKALLLKIDAAILEIRGG